MVARYFINGCKANCEALVLVVIDVDAYAIVVNQREAGH